MRRTNRLLGEVLDVAVLAASAYVGFWKLFIKLGLGFVVFAVVNGLGQGLHVWGAANPDTHGYYDGGLVTSLLIGVYVLWALVVTLLTCGRGVRNLFWRGP